MVSLVCNWEFGQVSCGGDGVLVERWSLLSPSWFLFLLDNYLIKSRISISTLVTELYQNPIWCLGSVCTGNILESVLVELICRRVSISYLVFDLCQKPIIFVLWCVVSM